MRRTIDRAWHWLTWSAHSVQLGRLRVTVRRLCQGMTPRGVYYDPHCGDVAYLHVHCSPFKLEVTWI